MEYLPDHLGDQTLPQDRKSISEWNVYLPINSDRATYIKNCFLTNTVTLTNVNGEIIHKVSIGNLALQNLTFPADETETGSLVICATSPYSGKLYVIDVFNLQTQYVDQLEHQYRFIKSTAKGSAEVVIDGDNGLVQISADHETNGGILAITISNKQQSAQLKVNVNGNIIINATGNITVQGSKQVDVQVFPGSTTDVTTGVHVIDKKISFNDGKEPMVLGDTLATLLSDLITEISSSTTTTSIGIQPLINAQKIAAYKDKLDTIKSQLGFTS